MTYLKKLIISFIAVLLIVGGINWFIDPFGMYWSPHISGVNTTKPEASTRSRISKAYQVNQIQPTILIVGNSRAEMGIDPQHPLFEDQAVYNQAMPGAGISMQVDYAMNAIAQNTTIKQLYMGIDFIDFLISDKLVFESPKINEINPNYAFRLTKLKQQSSTSYIKRNKELAGFIFSLDALAASIKTLTQQYSLVSSIDQYGFNTAKSYQAIMKSEGIKPLFQQKLQEIDKRLDRKLLIKQQEHFPYSSNFAQLNKLMKHATANNIKVTLFINPYHYSYLHVIADNQQLDNFFQWKKLLTQYLTTQALQNTPLWDFSHINSVITENVPVNSPKTMMGWFWEPAHYKAELGSRMLKSMMNQTSETTAFGHQLTPKNVVEFNTQDRKRLKDSRSKWRHLQAELNL